MNTNLLNNLQAAIMLGDAELIAEATLAYESQCQAYWSETRPQAKRSEYATNYTGGYHINGNMAAPVRR